MTSSKFSRDGSTNSALVVAPALVNRLYADVDTGWEEVFDDVYPFGCGVAY